jgi:hypothetical protein
MEAVAWCLRFNQPVPPWARDGFIAAVNRVSSLDAASWDQAFGKPFPRGSKVDTLRAKSERKLEVWAKVLTLRRRRPRPKDIFELVRIELGVSRATVKREFEEVKKAVSRASALSAGVLTFLTGDSSESPRGSGSNNGRIMNR